MIPSQRVTNPYVDLCESRQDASDGVVGKGKAITEVRKVGSGFLPSKLLERIPCWETDLWGYLCSDPACICTKRRGQ